MDGVGASSEDLFTRRIQVNMSRKIVIAVVPDRYDTRNTAFAVYGTAYGDTPVFGRGEAILERVFRMLDGSCGVLVVSTRSNLGLLLACGWASLTRATITLATEKDVDGKVTIGVSMERRDATEGSLLEDLIALGKKSVWNLGDPTCVVSG